MAALLGPEDQQAKQMFQKIANQMDGALQELQQRQQHIQEQEPQYKQ